MSAAVDVVPGVPADVSVGIGADGVATVELCRPPENFLDLSLVRSLAQAYEALDADPRCRAIVVCSRGRHFCAGAGFSGRSGAAPGGTRAVYREALRLFAARTPVVAAVQGAAVGGGLGLACSADFRVGSVTSRFAANFARLGLHHGFGLSVTLPGIVGRQRSLDLLYTGRRVGGEEAAAIGLVDRLAPVERVRSVAHRFAAEIAESAPLAVVSIRATMRGGDLPQRLQAALHHEAVEQGRLRATADFVEGVRAYAERRRPQFSGQ